METIQINDEHCHLITPTKFAIILCSHPKTNYPLSLNGEVGKELRCVRLTTSSDIVG
jgi:hypothetical protein